MSLKSNVNSKKDDPTICMVADCTRKAIWQNARSRRAKKGEALRGYCGAHRDLATASPMSDRLAARYDARTARWGW